MTARPIRTFGLVAVMALALIACSDDGGGTAADGTSTPPAATDAAETTAPGSTDPTPTEPTGGDYVPGEIEYRVVNLLSAPVDVYVRTDGFVEAFLMQEGLAAGETSGFYAPPTDGRLVVTEAGAGDATCVVGCDHFIAELSAFASDGAVHTVFLYEEAGVAAAFDLWESPEPESVGNSNAMPPADPANGLVIVTAIAVAEADFGLRLGIDGVSGCLEPTNLTGVLVGGNQTPAFTYSGDSADVLLYANDDRDCALEPVGGPFTVTGGAGTRSHLFLTGSPGAMDGLVLAMVGSEQPDTPDPALRDDAIALFATGLVDEVGLTQEQADCAAGYVVDALGMSMLVENGELIDIDLLGAEAQDIAVDTLFASLADCDIDPAVLGG
jgi:hypothetical protein